MQDVLGRRLLSLHTDFSTVTGEHTIVFTLSSAPEPDTLGGTKA